MCQCAFQASHTSSWSPQPHLYHCLVLEPCHPACGLPAHLAPADQPGSALLWPLGAQKPHLPMQDSAGRVDGRQHHLPGSLPATSQAVVLPFVPIPSQPWPFCVGMCACPSPAGGRDLSEDGDLFCYVPRTGPVPGTGQAQRPVPGRVAQSEQLRGAASAASTRVSEAGGKGVSGPCPFCPSPPSGSRVW